jgi:hypothetical protein
VRYLIAGGLAVVAHGYNRMTVDVDLILDLDEANLKKAVAVFESLGFRPRAPVPLAQFADAAARQSWIRDKGLTVFSLFSDRHARTTVDLFVEAPLNFSNAYRDVANLPLAENLNAPFVSLNDLLYLKRQANRPRDLEDIRNLEKLHNAHE